MNNLREDLAKYAHTAWAGWMLYLFDKSTTNGDGTVTIPAWAVERWIRQCSSQYCELPEDERATDRIEADRIIEIFKAHHGGEG